MLEWLFGKRPPPDPPSIDRVWIDLAARDRALLREAQAGPIEVLAFFDETVERLRHQLPAGLVSRQDRHRPRGATIHLAERHPLPAENRALLERLQREAPGQVPIFHSALDEPLMLRFGGERVAELMRSMGLGPDEPVEHALVSRSLAQAREKVAERAGDRAVLSASSMAEWLDRCLGAQPQAKRTE